MDEGEQVDAVPCGVEGAGRGDEVPERDAARGGAGTRGRLRGTWGVGVGAFMGAGGLR